MKFSVELNSAPKQNTRFSASLHNFIAVKGNNYFPEHYRFYGNRNELRNYSLVTHNNESSLFAALNMVCSWCCKTHGVSACWLFETK